MTRVDFDPVVIIRNPQDVEINLVVNAAEENDGSNVLMDVDSKYAGITHLALRVSSIVDTMQVLKDNNIQFEPMTEEKKNESPDKIKTEGGEPIK